MHEPCCVRRVVLLGTGVWVDTRTVNAMSREGDRCGTVEIALHIDRELS
jgi:hypothetical protein